MEKLRQKIKTDLERIREYRTLRASLMASYRQGINPVVYKITCLKNDMFYIGSTVNPEIRFKMHLLDLRYGKHCNYKLTCDFNKYGESSFKFEVVESFMISISRKELYKKEQHYLDTLSPHYNINLNTTKPKRVKSKVKISSVPFDTKFRDQVATNVKNRWLNKALKIRGIDLSEFNNIREIKKILPYKSKDRNKILKLMRNILKSNNK